MRNALFLLFITAFNVFANDSYSQNTKVNLDMKDVTVAKVLSAIEEQSEFYFLFNARLIDVNRNISVKAENAKISDILSAVFKNDDVDYIVYGRQIILSPKSETKALAQLQQFTVTGKVTDSKGEPLIGVNVVVTGTTIGTTTDFDGKYRIEVPQGAKSLTFSFIGMKTVEIPVGNQTIIDVTLLEEVVGLEEVVVTAFGISKEAKQLTYVAQQVTGEKISATGNIDLNKSLQGKIAGVTVNQLSGMPGESVKITIRGSSSIAGNNTPLYVVDGFPVGTDVSFKIDPNDVESISVLKGAAASALYGLRASNGVILITTKKGLKNEIGRPTISFNAVYSFDRLSIYPPMQKIYGQGENFVFNPNSAFSWGPRIDQMGTYTNQLGEQEEARAYDNIRDFFRTGGTMNNNLNISNRFAQGNYSVGISYNNQMGIIDYTGLKDYGFKLAGDYELSKKLIFSPSIKSRL